MFFKKQNALTRFILKYQIAVILTGSFLSWVQEQEKSSHGLKSSPSMYRQ